MKKREDKPSEESCVTCYDYSNQFKDHEKFHHYSQLYGLKYTKYSKTEMKKEIFVLPPMDQLNLKLEEDNTLHYLPFKETLPNPVKSLVSNLDSCLSVKKIFVSDNDVSFLLQGTYNPKYRHFDKILLYPILRTVLYYDNVDVEGFLTYANCNIIPVGE